MWMRSWMSVACAGVLACGGESSTTDAGSDAADASACSVTAATSPSGTTTNGCALLARDASACMAARQSAGLGGAWLAFSCRVDLAIVQKGAESFVQVTTDSQPDYPSNYFATTTGCKTSFTPSFPDPNLIMPKSIVMLVPLAPSAATQAMSLGAVGVAINGVVIFENQAAPGDDIFQESDSFDECQGHPQNTGMYHYHSEPYAISYDDDRLIGVLRDGSFVYGRRDPDGTVPSSLDAAGGHTSVTIDSPQTPIYHHHANLQTSTNPKTTGQTVWFLTTGQYAGPPGTCTGC